MKADYPRFNALYFHEELTEHFSLAAAEHRFLRRFRGKANRFTAALMLKSLGYLGYFPKRSREIPIAIRRFVGQQLGDPQLIDVPGVVAQRSRVRQWADIRAFTGWRPATTEDKRMLRAWLREEGVISAPTPDKLFPLACQRLRHLQIELPSEAELQRVVAAALRSYVHTLYRRVTAGLSSTTRKKLDAVLRVPRGSTLSGFEQLKLDPGKPGLKTLHAETAKLTQLRALQVPAALFRDVPWRMLRLLTRRAGNEKAVQMRAHPAAVRRALLAIFIHVRTAEVTDDVATALVETIQKLDRGSKQHYTRLLLRDAEELEWRRDLLGQIADTALLYPEKTIREIIFPLVGETRLSELATEHRVQGPHGRHLRQEVLYRKFVRHYRRLLPLILEHLSFRSDERYRPVMEALASIQRTLHSRARHFAEPVPIKGVVPRNWQDRVIENVKGTTKIHRRYYELCALHQLQRGLKCKEVWVEGSLAYRNPSEDLPRDWDQRERRAAHYQKLGQPSDSQDFIEGLRQRLTQALTHFNRQLPTLSHVRIREPKSDRQETGLLVLDKLPRQTEPTSLGLIKDAIQRQYGMLELLEVFAEADRLAEFTRFFQHSGTKQVRSRGQLQPLLLFALFAEGTNLGLKRVVNASQRMTYEELLYVRKTYLSVAALRNANIAVVNKILECRNTRLWGDARACASDGKRFESWSQNLITEWRTRYRGEGVLVYWHVETNAVCLYSQLKSFSSSEVASMVEGLIRHDTEMRVDRNFVDSHGQSEVAFAFCHLLGTVRLMPRLKRIKYERLYLPANNTADDFPHLHGILTRPIQWDWIAAQYDAMIQAAVGLKDGTASAEAILKRYNSYNRSHPTYRALVEVGKAEKTIFLCEYLASRARQYEVNNGLQVVENWNATNHFICYGQRGEFTTNSREEQEVRVLALQLLQNCLMLINTILVERTVEQQKLWPRLTREDFRGLTPLFYNHINPYGTFSLDLTRRSFLDVA